MAIKANLINSAPFSLLGNAYDDKGLHHLPKKEILKLENTNSKQDMEITIIHHSPEWFDDPTKKDLYRIIPQYSDMVFTGHEHYKASGEFSLNQSSSILVSQSKALYGTAEEEGYSCFLFDSNSRKIYEYEFVRKNQKYNLTNQTEERISPKNEFGFSFRKEFSGSLEKDSGLYLDKNYLEYFVFPGLRIVAEKREPDITNIESFKRVIEKYRSITITGKLRCGKSTLAKYLCYSLSKDYVVILFCPSDFYLNPSKSLSSVISKQYTAETSIDRVLQNEPTKNILIVDDADRVQNDLLDAFIKQYENNFGTIILIKSDEYNLNVTEKTIAQLSGEDRCSLCILPFYFAKRKELINKICQNLYPESDALEDSQSILSEIGNQLEIFDLTPEFIHQYTDYYHSLTHDRNNNSNNVFNSVFETNMNARIIEEIGKTNASIALVILEKMAYYMHSNRKGTITTQEYIEIADRYIKEYDVKFAKNTLLVELIKAKILGNDDLNDHIYFTSTSVLAYFAAKAINHNIHSDPQSGELKYLLDHLCFSPNDEIVLFLVYLTESETLLKAVEDSIKTHMDKWPIYSFENNQYRNIVGVEFPKPTLPGIADKKEYEEERDQVERELYYGDDYDEKLYKYSEEEVNKEGNQIIIGLKNLEILAKLLPNFYHILRVPEKKKIVQDLYIYPNKFEASSGSVGRNESLIWQQGRDI